jgi:hypothetical protein
MAALLRLFSGCLQGGDAHGAYDAPPILQSFPYGVICVDSVNTTVDLEKSRNSRYSPTTRTTRYNYVRTSLEGMTPFDTLPDDGYDMHVNNPFVDGYLSGRRASLALYKRKRSLTRATSGSIRSQDTSENILEYSRNLVIVDKDNVEGTTFKEQTPLTSQRSDPTDPSSSCVADFVQLSLSEGPSSQSEYEKAVLQ